MPEPLPLSLHSTPQRPACGHVQAGVVASVPAQVVPRTWSTLAQQASRTAGMESEDMGAICTFRSRPSVTQKSLMDPTTWKATEANGRGPARVSGRLRSTCFLPLFFFSWGSSSILSGIGGKAWLLQIVAVGFC